MGCVANVRLSSKSPMLERERLATLGGALHAALSKSRYRIHMRADILFARGLRANDCGDPDLVGDT